MIRQLFNRAILAIGLLVAGAMFYGAAHDPWAFAQTIGPPPSAGGGGTPCTTTALSIQYNNAGAFGCATIMTYSSGALHIGAAQGAQPILFDVSTSSLSPRIQLGYYGILILGGVDGVIGFGSDANATAIEIQTGGGQAANNEFAWTSTIGNAASNYTGIAGLASAVIEINNGKPVSAGGALGDIQTRLNYTSGFAIGSLPTPSAAGARAYVTDQLTTCAAIGVAPTAGGSVKCPVFYNGSAWVGG